MQIIIKFVFFENKRNWKDDNVLNLFLIGFYYDNLGSFGSWITRKVKENF